MNSGIRLMREGDLLQVNALLSRAFSQGRADDGYLHTDVPMCRSEFLRMYLGQNPEGCFVYLENGRLLGAAFTHVWGKRGWFGPLAVAPERHLMGIGKHLVAACIAHLQKRGCTTIGLETNPRSNRNLGFYGRLSFLPSVLCIDMIRPVKTEPPASGTPPHQIFIYSELSEADRREFLKHVRNLILWSDGDADYSSLIVSAAHYGVGDALLFFRGSTPIAFAALQTLPTLAEEQNSIMRLFAFAAHPQMPDNYLSIVVRDLLAFAQQQSFDRLLIRVPMHSGRLYRILLEGQFRVVNADIRLVLEGFDEKPNRGVLIERWV
ncbi:MAG: GNAT family N-acetyltransferase [candidate division KSB1 bacterium]|nr:GNAT family N-acetyltransferase [candidate division KSB1 bacterium]MDZ7345950.1 GNAT family N-acetyltransferase [candidate division KSB1 bacterium]